MPAATSASWLVKSCGSPTSQAGRLGARPDFTAPPETIRPLLVWPDVRALLEPIAVCFADGEQPLAAMIGTLRETAQALCGDMLWAGPAGRAAAELLADLEAEAANGPPTADPAR